MDRREFVKLSLAGAGAVLLGGVPRAGEAQGLTVADPASTFFATAFSEYAATVTTDSTGDLWPTCWADDDYVYTANGDGQGFGDDPMAAIVVNRIAGTPETGLRGERLAAGDAVAKPHADPKLYNAKPTGIVAVDGNGDGRDELYLAVQDLRFAPASTAFDDAVDATVVKSEDYGLTWQQSSEPMFTGHVFTTVMFLDFGRSQEHARSLGPENAGYVYAYGLDGNWRDSYSNEVTSPTSLYLARVPRNSIQQRDTWRFYAGAGSDGSPQWSASIGEKAPVLTDERRLYADLHGEGRRDLTVVSQGGVLYNAPLRRFIYTSWTEYTFEFYEAPAPWGPWRLFMSKDFGAQPWFGRPGRARLLPVPGGHDVPTPETGEPKPACAGPKNGGYAPTIPAKFVSADGTRMWLQSNWFLNVACGLPNYEFSLRRFHVSPRRPGDPGQNPPDPADNLAAPGRRPFPIEKSAHYGHGDYLNNGVRGESEDSFDGARKQADFWGYVWQDEYWIDRVVYTTGSMFSDGGWFARDLTVQVRQGANWVGVSGLTTAPAYPYDSTAGPNKTYVLAFDPIAGDGVRITGIPGGTATFTSIAELEVYFDGR
ncbi:DUF4185 domain-containing protein [Saccharopolyspora elongata]|uniref:DUF4185 domain-containing protein n=1 Tax=Saccharopolyspora elongata TaxID=2530387 RepID=A0A4R4Z1A3_9PSEU|nr:DUF4185 domain-containing protein [Saccharopolyspora elongata]TDD51711.1 DUF4185 domain-containing protein [Saccharopolyspora elongata]